MLYRCRCGIDSLLGRGFQLADGLLDLVSHIALEVLDVADEELLQAAKQISLLRLPNDADQLELKRAFRDLVELGQDGLDGELEDG